MCYSAIISHRTTTKLYNEFMVDLCLGQKRMFLEKAQEEIHIRITYRYTGSTGAPPRNLFLIGSGSLHWEPQYLHFQVVSSRMEHPAPWLLLGSPVADTTMCWCIQVCKWTGIPALVEHHPEKQNKKGGERNTRRYTKPGFNTNIIIFQILCQAWFRI